MALLLSSTPRLAASIRFILAVRQLQAASDRDFGLIVHHILSEQFPGQKIDPTPSEIGRKLMMIAQRELQKSPTDAQDSIMDFLTYLTTGSQYETDENGEVLREVDEETGESKAVKRKTKKPWDFAKDFDDPNKALRALYTNLRRRSIDKSKAKAKKQKRERSIDDAFGTRGENGGASSGGEARMPTPDENSLGKALDDQSAIKEFMEVLDKHVGDLRDSLPLEQQVMFDLVFEEGEGGFTSDVKANMGQATALKDMLTAEGATDEMKALYKKNEKRWSGFVSTTRGKLLSSIRDFIENELPQADVDVLWDEFFSDTTPESVARKEQEAAKGKDQYQTDIDTRKLGRLKWKQENDGELSAADQKEFDRLKEKLEKAGVKADLVKSINPDLKGNKLKQEQKREERAKKEKQDEGEVPKAASTLSPSDLSVVLRRVAAAIDNSNRPQRTLVANALKNILKNIS